MTSSNNTPTTLSTTPTDYPSKRVRTLFRVVGIEEISLHNSAGKAENQQTPYIEVCRRFPEDNAMVSLIFFHELDQDVKESSIVDTSPTRLESVVKTLLNERVTGSWGQIQNYNGEKYYSTDLDDPENTKKLVAEVPIIPEAIITEAARELVTELRRIMKTKTPPPSLEITWWKEGEDDKK